MSGLAAPSPVWGHLFGPMTWSEWRELNPYYQLGELDCHASSTSTLQTSRRPRLAVGDRRVPVLASYVYRARGYTAKIKSAYDDSHYSVGQDGWITDSLPDISETDLVVWVTW